MYAYENLWVCKNDFCFIWYVKNLSWKCNSMHAYDKGMPRKDPNGFWDKVGKENILYKLKDGDINENILYELKGI